MPMRMRSSRLEFENEHVKDGCLLWLFQNNIETIDFQLHTPIFPEPGYKVEEQEDPPIFSLPFKPRPHPTPTNPSYSSNNSS